jgi:hypothetical protein
VEGAIAEAAAGESGDVEEGVDAAEFGETVGEDGFGCVLFEEVADPAFGSGFGAEFEAGFFLASSHEEVGAFGSGESGGGGSYAGGPGDDEGFVGKAGGGGHFDW